MRYGRRRENAAVKNAVVNHNVKNSYEIIRAEEEWQRAGAYSVRIEGMNRQHHISLREEFDEHDGEGTKYIVALDDGYPIATCRFYENSKESAILGRVVVLPEYRRRKLGYRVVREAELWMQELGYREILIDSRVEVIPFYEKLGYMHMDDTRRKSGNFDCVRMHKFVGGTGDDRYHCHNDQRGKGRGEVR